jgi:predicted kinase
MSGTTTLHVLSGKLASGKTTLARQIAHEYGAVLICEDIWLDKLFPGEILSFEDYLLRSRKFRAALGPHLRALLQSATSVVLDFGGNVPAERAWVRNLAEGRAEVVCHYIQASDDVCKQQLRRRNAELPEGSQHTTDDEFDAITRYFVAPDAGEGFVLRLYEAGRAPGPLLKTTG